MIRVELSRPSDWECVGARWRALEDRCGASFFQSWTWLGCMADRRFPDPLLMEAFDGEQPVGLALFNRRGGSLFLSETGEPLLDGLTVEHNGVLAIPELRRPVQAACISAARKAARRVVMSGIGDDALQAASETGAVLPVRRSPAPCVDLDALRADGASLADSLSANTRYQIARSNRLYAEAGALRAESAPDEATASAYFDRLIDLHTASWRERGKPGAFASPLIREFHRTLIRRGLRRDEVDIWRVSAGEASVGFLYNFRVRRTISAYQSGFSGDGTTRRKPGLTCHALVIQSYLDAGAGCYDFLAGDHRYKHSFSKLHQDLHWIELARRGSLRWIGWQAKHTAAYLKNTIRSR